MIAFIPVWVSPRITLAKHLRSQATTRQFHTAVMLTADFALERRTHVLVSDNDSFILLRIL